MKHTLVALFALCVAVGTIRAEGEAVPPLLINGGFEEGLAGWNPHHSSISIVSVLPEAAHDGTHGLRIADPGPEKAGTVNGTPIALGAAKTVKFGGWVRIVSGRGAAVNLAFQDAAGAKISEIRSGVNSSQWRAIERKAPVPAGATHVMVQLRTWKPDEATVDFDSFVLTFE